ncbi:MAG: creatininase family protein [Coriobacteriales bacterium]|nr:creatininase family protein [Coriobacteriales bacterium]
MKLARITWPQAKSYFEWHDTVLIGVGSLECHGLHNPLGTDTMAPDYLVNRIDELYPEVLIAPTVPYGATNDLMGFPGTVSLGVQGLIDVLTHIVEALWSYGARRFVFINGHGGNVKSISCVCQDINKKGGIGILMNWWKMAPQLNPAWGGGHGDGMETSANLAIDPDAVDLTSIAPEGLRNDMGPAFTTTGWMSIEFEGVEVDAPRPLVRMASNGWVAEGHTNPPEAASAELGFAMLNGTAEYIVKFVQALVKVPLPSPLYADDELDQGLAYLQNLVKEAENI